MVPGTDYKIQASTRRCARTGRELKPGEKFFSVLYDRGDSWVREDISLQAWQGPPGDAFSFWMARVPVKEQPRRLPIEDDLLLDCFFRLADAVEPQKVSFRYLLALLLMRRKRLHFEEARQEGGKEVLWLRCPQTHKLYQVVNPQLTEQELADVQEEVLKVLGLSDS